MAERTQTRPATAAPTIRFQAQVRRIERWTIVRLPDDASAELPSRGQVAVEGTMDGHAVQTVLEPDGRRGHWLKVDEALRDALALQDGDSVAVELQRSKDWPEPSMPEDLATALAEAPDVSAHWSDITPMARWEWVRWITATRSPETRRRRVEVGISKLRAGKRRPCCFDLTACTDPDLSKSGRLVDGV
jgi:hypothetical protein